MTDAERDELNLARIKELLSIYRADQCSSGLAEAMLSMLNVRMHEAYEKGRMECDCKMPYGGGGWVG